MAIPQLALFTKTDPGVDNINALTLFVNQLWRFVYSFMNTTINLATVTTGPVNMTPDQRVLIVKCNNAAITINPPLLPYVNETHTIKDGDGTGAGNITVQGGGINIDGSASFAFTLQRQAITLCYDGTAWQIIA